MFMKAEFFGQRNRSLSAYKAPLHLNFVDARRMNAFGRENPGDFLATVCLYLFLVAVSAHLVVPEKIYAKKELGSVQGRRARPFG